MGKRKKERHNSKIRRKIRRLEQKLRDSSTSTDDEGYDRFYPRSQNTPESPQFSSHSDASENDIAARSSVVAPVSPPCAASAIDATAPNLLSQDPGPSSIDAETGVASDGVLPPEILDALGDPIGKEEVLGPPINEEIAKRWGRVLVEGLTKEVKDTLKKILIPENFSLSKAPKLNLEFSAVLSDNIKHRDKLLEKAQNQLGLGIAGLTNLASSIIKEDHPKVELLKRLSEVSQIFLDLHHENTQHRRKLITTSLDKKFTSTLSDAKRDSFLFGANLGDKIKATKTAEKSGLQVRRNTVNVPSTSRQQVNWRGPPRYQSNKTPKPGGPKPRYQNQSSNQGHSAQHVRRQPAASRAPPTRKTDYKTRRNQ